MFSTSYAATASPLHAGMLTTILASSSQHSLTGVLISWFLIDLQEANLRPLRLDSDDPLHFSTHADDSLPSFVAAPRADGARVESTSGEPVHEGVDVLQDIAENDVYQRVEDSLSAFVDISEA